MSIVRWVLPGLFLVASCGGGSSGVTTSTADAPPTTEPLPSITTAVTSTTPTNAVTTTSPPPTPSTTLPPTTATTQPPGVPGPLVSLPVGAGGIEYRGGGPELERTGPTVFAVDPDGGIHIADPVGRRVVSVVDGVQTVVELVPLDVLAVTAMSAADDHLLVVEVFFSPVRQRLHRLGYDGVIRESIDLPEGFRLENGLSGVRSGAGEDIVLEYEEGAHYGVWDAATGTFEMLDRLTIGPTTVVSRAPDLVIDGTTITADLEGVAGGLVYLGTAADGTHLVLRHDVTVVDGVFVVLSTVEWYAPGGELLGSARIPAIDEQFISAPPGIAMTADGRALALVALEDAVEVIELPRRPGRITEFDAPV